MCEKCVEAATVLSQILPIQYGPDKLREWAVKQQLTEITRMVAAYLILTGSFTDVTSRCINCGHKVYWDEKNKKLVCSDDKGNIFMKRCFELKIPPTMY